MPAPHPAEPGRHANCLDGSADHPRVLVRVPDRLRQMNAVSRPFPAATTNERNQANRVVAGRCPTCGREAKRTPEQNAGLHAVLTDILKQMEWNGERLSKEEWKRLLTAGWMKATGRRAKMVRALDGQGIEVLYQRTSELSKSECSELLEFITAWAVDQGVRLTETRYV